MRQSIELGNLKKRLTVILSEACQKAKEILARDEKKGEDSELGKNITGGREV